MLLAAAVCAGTLAGAASEEPLTPVTPHESLHEEKVELGRRLFHDVRLSSGDMVACASCHELSRGGDDDRVRANSLQGAPLDFNSPTIFNVARNFRFNWRGNFRTLEEQNEAALLDSRLMNATWREVLSKLAADRNYRNAFARLYGSQLEPAQVLDALAAFQRSLVTPDSRFDRRLRGERDAINEEEERGYLLFKAYGCVACHQGMNVGGNLFQKFGIFRNPFAERGTVTEADLGRFALTGEEADRHVFRVPSLRNVAVTAPYFHDGSAASLEEAVDVMARSQLGRDLPAEDVAAIVAFLKTLTGEFEGRSLDPEAAHSER
jgi:cytochrome c peroxidase